MPRSSLILPWIPTDARVRLTDTGGRLLYEPEPEQDIASDQLSIIPEVEPIDFDRVIMGYHYDHMSRGDSTFFCCRCIRRNFNLERSRITNRQGRPVPTNPEDRITPVYFEVDETEAQTSCHHCGLPVRVRGPEPPPHFAVSADMHVNIRRCSECGGDFELTTNGFYKVAGRWSTRCRRCCDERRAQEIALGKRKLARRVRKLSRPRRFGVEIEFLGDKAEVRRRAHEQNLPCQIEDYNHQVRTAWKIINDGSLRTEDSGELISPPLRGEGGYAVLERACKALDHAGASTGTTCGLHVHHDAADMDLTSFGRVYRFYFTHQTAIGGLFTRDRCEGSQYAHLLDENEVGMIEDMSMRTRKYLRDYSRRFDRYRVLNAGAYNKYGTLEFRQHQGTLNAEEILAWVEFGQALIGWSNTDTPLLPVRSGIPKIVRALTPFGLSEERGDFLLQRVIDLSASRR